MILAIVIVGFVVGTILSLRFRALVLLPALLFAAITTVAICFANRTGAGIVVLAVLAVMGSLQCGYLAGSVVRYIIAQRADKHGGNAVRRVYR
jgi:hypothetical protein